MCTELDSAAAGIRLENSYMLSHKSQAITNLIKSARDPQSHPSKLLYIHQAKTNKSPPKLPLLQRPQQPKTHRAKRKGQLEANVAPVRRIPDPLAHGPDEPHLRHAHHGAEDAEAKGEHGGDAGREEARVVPDGDVVLALFEDEVLG